MKTTTAVCILAAVSVLDMSEPKNSSDNDSMYVVSVSFGYASEVGTDASSDEDDGDSDWELSGGESDEE